MTRRSKSSHRWLERQRRDPYARQAQQEGQISRAHFKLQQLDERYRLLRPGMRVLELGAAPGGWTRFLEERLRGGLLIACDSRPITAGGDTVEKAPREEILYVGQGGELTAVRWNDWKVNFAGVDGNIATGTRKVTGWPLSVNLRADPYEKMPFESSMYIRWYADNIWLFVPVQQKVKEFLVTTPQFPFQEGASLNAANINYMTLKAAAALKRLQEIESLGSPQN